MIGGRGRPLPPEAYGVALASLPAMGPARLRALLGELSPQEAWEQVLAGRATSTAAVAEACQRDPAGVGRAWRAAAASIDPGQRLDSHAAGGVSVVLAGDDGYPPRLGADHEAPAVLFARGRLDSLHHSAPAVAIVGTRGASRYGREVARELAFHLAEAGVMVVSGLALGIDGAAHRGALAAGAPPTVGVVASGLDVVYPRGHRELWAEVGSHGVLLSEWPLGTAPEAWRFPVRNRVIAALACAVVLVESPHKGGSLHTIEAAIARGIPVMAVPGPVRSRGSELPNALLVEGCAPARDAVDVLVALDLLQAGQGAASARAARQAPAELPHDGEQRTVLEALRWDGSGFEDVVVATGLDPGRAGVALARLEQAGLVACRAGRWERVL